MCHYYAAKVPYLVNSFYEAEFELFWAVLCSLGSLVFVNFFQYIEYHLAYINKNDVANTGGPLLTWFFETLEKQLCKQKTM